MITGCFEMSVNGGRVFIWIYSHYTKNNGQSLRVLHRGRRNAFWAGVAIFAGSRRRGAVSLHQVASDVLQATGGVVDGTFEIMAVQAIFQYRQLHGPEILAGRVAGRALGPEKTVVIPRWRVEW